MAAEAATVLYHVSNSRFSFPSWNVETVRLANVLYQKANPATIGKQKEQHILPTGNKEHKQMVGHNM
jgi:hypothetical protein